MFANCPSSLRTPSPTLSTTRSLVAIPTLLSSSSSLIASQNGCHCLRRSPICFIWGVGFRWFTDLPICTPTVQPYKPPLSPEVFAIASCTCLIAIRSVSSIHLRPREELLFQSPSPHSKASARPQRHQPPICSRHTSCRASLSGAGDMVQEVMHQTLHSQKNRKPGGPIIPFWTFVPITSWNPLPSRPIQPRLFFLLR